MEKELQAYEDRKNKEKRLNKDLNMVKSSKNLSHVNSYNTVFNPDKQIRL